MCRASNRCATLQRIFTSASSRVTAACVLPIASMPQRGRANAPFSSNSQIEALSRITGSLDHRGAIVRDSLSASLSGFPLPSMPLAGLGAAVDLGEGTSELVLAREVFRKLS